MTFEDKLRYVLNELAKSKEPRTVASIFPEDAKKETDKVRDHLMYLEMVSPERKTPFDFHLQINTKGRRALKGLESLEI